MGQATHIHNWEKVSSDETGAIILCTGCPVMVPLDPEETKRFDQAYATQTEVEIDLTPFAQYVVVEKK